MDPFYYPFYYPINYWEWNVCLNFNIKFANVWSQIKQIWVLFTHLKLWVATQLQVGENLKY